MLSLALPRPTWAHRLPAGLKLSFLLIVTLAIFPLDDPRLLLLALAAVAALVASLGRDALRQFGRSLRPLALLAVIVLAFHVWQDRMAQGIVVTCRIFVLVGLASVVTMTTRLDDLIAIVERLAAPLAQFGLPPRALALSVAMVIRFIPVILARYDRLADAWRARSPRRPRARVIAPLMLSVLDDADHVAEALMARGGIAPHPPLPATERTPSDGT